MLGPLLSVIIPTYNRKAMLADALFGILNQSMGNFEVIIVDDCSSDGTQDYVKGLNDDRIRYIRREKNTGVHYNYSLGLAEARGKYIVFHDDDDFYTDYDFFAKALKIFAEHENESPPIVCVCSNAIEFNAETNEAMLVPRGRPGRVRGADYFTQGFGRKYMKPPSLFPTVFKTEILRNAGLEKIFMDDSETYWHAILQGDAWYIADDVGIYRMHSDSYTAGRGANPRADARRYGIIRERIRQRAMIYEKLSMIVGGEAARKWYANAAYDLLYFYDNQGRGFAETLRVFRIILEESSFMPELKNILSMKWIAKFPRNTLRKVTVLRKIYRNLKHSEEIRYINVDTIQKYRHNVQSSPVQSSPVQSSPVQSSPVQSVIVRNYSHIQQKKYARRNYLQCA